MNIIRNATLDDMDQLVTLFDAYRSFYNMKSDILATKVFLTERIKKEESIIFVACDTQNLLMGFVQLYPIFSTTRLKRLWLLNDLFVHEKVRGKGISKELIIQSQKFCMETSACGIILETAKANIIGNNLYVKMNFNIDSDHNYYEWTKH